MFSELRAFLNIEYFQSDRKKSKAEVMAEVIAKSKQHKVCYSSWFTC